MPRNQCSIHVDSRITGNAMQAQATFIRWPRRRSVSRIYFHCLRATLSHTHPNATTASTAPPITTPFQPA